MPWWGLICSCDINYQQVYTQQIKTHQDTLISVRYLRSTIKIVLILHPRPSGNLRQCSGLIINKVCIFHTLSLVAERS